MYTILVNNDNTLEATEKQRIVQRSKMVDNFRFLAPAVYNGVNMTECIALLEYLTPVGHEYKTEILVKADALYKEYVQYFLPIDTSFTKEAGSLEIQLSFILANITPEGVSQQIVRKTAPTYKIDIIPISAWSDVIPDDALSPIDQRLIMMSAQIQAIADVGNLSGSTHVDGLAYNNVTGQLQLTADGARVGNVVTINTATVVPPTPDDGGEDDGGDEGFPVVPFNDLV